MTFKVEKGIPMPEATQRNKYPFSEMKVGDSFLVKGFTAGRRAKVAARVYTYRYDVDFVHFTNEDGSTRIWRRK